MTAFVESCLDSMTDSATRIDRKSRTRKRVKKLIQALSHCKNILITTHIHPDPDALSSSQAIATLLETQLKEAKITIGLKGQIGGGINTAFTRTAHVEFKPLNDGAFAEYDGIVLVDTQPDFSNSPLPKDIQATAIIDHHRGRGRRPKAAYVDIRTDVGACASIIFSYFMELEQTIPAELASTMLYAIESDLAGVAGQQGGLDTLAISSLILLADTKKLYQMRYVDLPQSYFGSFRDAIDRAVRNDIVIVSHLDKVEYPEVPAVMADFLLRCEFTQWALVTAIHDGKLIFSLRTQSTNKSAGEVARRITNKIGVGGGHYTKAGGSIPLPEKTQVELERTRTKLRTRLLRALKIKVSRGQRLA